VLTTFGRRGVRAAIIAIVLVLAVTTAPLAQVTAPGCRSCAATCPMHRTGRLRCHDAGPLATQAHHCHSSSPTLATTGCHQDADPTTPSLAPAVLPPRASWHTRPRVDACLSASGIVNTRASEPPDTPPPIAS
jgi:hypothetical protein